MAIVKQEKAKVKSNAKLARHLEGIQVGDVELLAGVGYGHLLLDVLIKYFLRHHHYIVGLGDEADERPVEEEQDQTQFQPAAVAMSSISRAATVDHLVIPRPLLFSGSYGVNMITLNAGYRLSNLRR